MKTPAAAATEAGEGEGEKKKNDLLQQFFYANRAGFTSPPRSWTIDGSLLVVRYGAADRVPS